MAGELFNLSFWLDFINVALSSVLVILAFSLLAYTLTYNFRDAVARWFALLLFCVMITYASEVALDRVVTAASANRWLRFQWLGIALLPAVCYNFSLAVLHTTNYRIGRRRWIGWATLVVSGVSAISALAGSALVGQVHYRPPISYLEAGPFFFLFALYYIGIIGLALANIWKARQRCLTDSTRERMTYLLVAFAAPAIGIFPYLIGFSRLTGDRDAGALVLALAILVNSAVAVMLIIMSYSVAYFGVLTPDRVVRYRLLRFFFRGPLVAIMVILAMLTVPRVERLLGLPRDIVLFSVITGVIVLSQLILSVTKSFVDRLVYREDREEVAWLRELDRRLLATSDLRQFLENNLVSLCELLRVPAGFVAATAGPDLMLEVVVGPAQTRDQVMAVDDWGEALTAALKREEAPTRPLIHAGFWLWPLVERRQEGVQVLGVLGVKARTETPQLTPDEAEVLEEMLQSVARALIDRQLQQRVFVALRRIIPDIERIQQMRTAVPYLAQESDESPASALLNPSPIHSPEFEAWVKDALSHYWGGPKLTRSPLVQLRVVNEVLSQADDNPTKALRLVLGSAIEKLRPEGKQNFSAPEWLLYNILELRFIQGRKVREIADRLAISESDLYRKQRVAIGQVARVLTEMEQGNGLDLNGRLDAYPGGDSRSDGAANPQERRQADQVN
ncbi:MAG TPA: histidine kinase N-terminal 7TM domain-containing protein [Caldilineaceae bacterium]|nr:histidine kinase N-terminal 7TM domain-containing protein [Caldilineaceae bacterium]